MNKFIFLCFLIIFQIDLFAQQLTLEKIIGEQNTSNYELGESFDFKIENGLITVFDNSQTLILDTVGNFIERNYNIPPNDYHVIWSIIDSTGTKYYIDISKIGSITKEGFKVEIELYNIPGSRDSYFSTRNILVDQNNIYILIKDGIDIFNKSNFRFIRTIHKSSSNNTIKLNKPNRIRYDKYKSIYVSNFFQLNKIIKVNNNYIYDSLFELKVYYEYFYPFEIINDEIFCVTSDRKAINVVNLDGRFKRTIKIDTSINEYNNFKKIDNLLVFNSKKKSGNLFFDTEGNEIKATNKYSNNKLIRGGLGVFDRKGRYYESFYYEINIFDEKLDFVSKIKYFDIKNVKQRNYNLIDEKSKSKLKFNTYYEEDNFSLSYIKKILIYKNFLYILDENRLLVTTQNGEFVAQLLNEKNTDFEEISDFEIIDNRLYIVNSVNDKIYVFKIKNNYWLYKVDIQVNDFFENAIQLDFIGKNNYNTQFIDKSKR